MAVEFKLKRSSVSGRVPATSSIDYGELAINTYDGILYLKKNDGNGDSVVPIQQVTEYNFAIDNSPFSNTRSNNLSGVLRDLDRAITTNQTFEIGADDSTIRSVGPGETVSFLGSGGITTASDDEGNITIDGPDLSSYVTLTGTQTLTNKTLDTPTITGTIALTSTSATTPPLQLTASSLNDGVGALRIDSVEPDIYLNDTDGGFATVTFANNSVPRAAFGRNSGDDFYLTVRDPNSNSGNWRNDTFVVDSSTGNISLGYNLLVSGALTINNEFTFPTTDGANGQTLVTNGNGTVSWTTLSGAGGAATLDGLLDVDTTTTSPEVGQVLKYDGTNWTPADSTSDTVLETTTVSKDDDVFAISIIMG